MSAEVTLELDGQTFEVSLEQTEDGWQASVDGQAFPLRIDRTGHAALVSAGAMVHAVRIPDAHTAEVDGTPLPMRILSLEGVAGAQSDLVGLHGPMHPPMTGRVETICVQEGQEVAAGEVLFVLEAMKMRNEVKAPADGIIGTISVAAGAAVEPSDVILELLAKAD